MVDLNGVCGDYGGVTLAGKPCRQPAGWQSHLPHDGRCWRHDQNAIDAREAGKATALATLEAFAEDSDGLRRGGLTAAAAAAGVTTGTLRSWMEAEAEFGESVRRLIGVFDAARALAVEDKVYGRIMDDRATPAEIIFFLKNRDKERWVEGLSLPKYGDKPITENAGQSARAKLSARIAEMASRRAAARATEAQAQSTRPSSADAGSDDMDEAGDE